MKLSLKMIAERLEDPIQVLKFKDMYSKVRLGRPVFLTHEQTLKKDTLYLALAEQLPEDLTFEEGCGLLLIGNRETDIRNIPSVILLGESTDLPTLHNAVHSICNLFDDWEQDLTFVSLHFSRFTAMEHFLASSAVIFENPLLLSDTSFHVLSTEIGEDLFQRSEVSSMTRIFTAPNQQSVYYSQIPETLLKELRTKPFFRLLQTETSIFPVSEDVPAHRLLIQNLIYRNKISYHLAVLESQRPFRETDYVLLEFLASYMQNSLRQEFTNEDPETISELLSAAVSSGSLNRSAIRKELPKRGWSVEDCYVILCLDSLQENLFFNSLLQYSFRLFGNASSLVMFRQKEHLGILLNLTRQFAGSEPEPAGKEEKQILLASMMEKDLIPFLQEHHLKAGVSNLFQNLYDFLCFYQQAEFAGKASSGQPDHSCVSFFRDRALDYILQTSVSAFPAEELLSPVYLRLKEHDKANNTEYLKTLQEYLRQNLNAVQTASALYMHRATIIYRLRRICEIGQTNLKEPDELLHLALSFKLDSAGPDT